MVIDSTNSYVLRGKTGWSNSIQVNNGWFVGYVETNDGVYFFATNIEPQEGFDMSYFPKTLSG